MSYSYQLSFGPSSTGPWTLFDTTANTSDTVINLAPNTTYYLQVVTVDSITGLSSAPVIAGPFQTQTVQVESPEGTAIILASNPTGQIVASRTPGTASPTGPYDIWTITSTGVIARNGDTTFGTSANVIELFYHNHTVYQENSALNWWFWSGTTWTPTTDPRPLTPTISVSTIAAQNTGTPFSISGVMTNYTAAPTLQYMDNATGIWNSLPAGASVTTTSFTFTHPSLTSANAAETVSVRDANNISVLGISNSFAVSVFVPPSPALFITSIPQELTGSSFTVSGTIQGYSSAPTLQYQDNLTGAFIAFPVGATVSSTTFSFLHPAVASPIGAMTITVHDANAPTVIVTSNAFAVINPPVQKIAIATITSETTNAAFAIAGSLSGYTTPPTLQYEDNLSGTWIAFPTGSSISATAWTFTHPGLPASASSNVSVRDANNTSVSAQSNSFAVITPVLAVPGAPTIAVTPANTSANVAITPATTGGAIDHGGYQINFKKSTASSFTAGPFVAVITPNSGSFTDAQGEVWAIAASTGAAFGTITVNGALDTPSADVVIMIMIPLVGGGTAVYQQNSIGNWYTQTTPFASGGWAGPSTTNPLQSPGVQIGGLTATTAYNFEATEANSSGTGNLSTIINASTTSGPPPPPTGAITVNGTTGKLIRNNSEFLLKGLAIVPEFSSASAPNGATIVRTFPGINFVNFAIGGSGVGYQQSQGIASSWFAQIDDLIANGLVVMISDYQPGQPQVRTGSDAQAAFAWYGQFAQHYASNPNVVFTTENEVFDNGGALGAYHQGVYNAVRNAGCPNLIFFETEAGNPDDFTGFLSPSAYGVMTNVGWNIHVYPWEFVGVPGTQASHTAQVKQNVTNIQGYARSADGIMPVLMGEGGNTSCGNVSNKCLSPDDIQVGGNWLVPGAFYAATALGAGNLCGFAFWLWSWENSATGNPDQDTAVALETGQLTSEGIQLAARLAQNP